MSKRSQHKAQISYIDNSESALSLSLLFAHFLRDACNILNPFIY